MHKIKLIVNRLLQLGTEKVSPELKSFVVLVNLNGITYFALDLILAFVFYYIIGDMHISIAHICAAFAFLICSLGFNFMGWTNASRLSTGMIGSLLVVCCALYLGSQSFAAGTLLLGAIFPFTYFSLSERKLVIISASFPVFGYFVLIATNYHVGPQVGQLSQFSLLLLRSIFFIFPLTGIIMNCYTAVSESNRKNEVLAESKKVIELIFYALMHDLATPMQIISILSQAGSSAGSLPPEKLKRMNSSTEQMIRIFKNLQTVAQTSTDGKCSLQLEKCSLQELITEAVNFSSEQAKIKNVEMEFDQSEVKEVINVLVDRDIFIFQIVTNFITNSLKFSESGQKIRVTLKMLDHMNVEIKIRDWGKGIPPEKISNLFSWSKRTSTSGTLGEKGTGLGLPLAMTFLKSMHGDIRVKSSILPGSLAGTEILITLPTFGSLQKNLAA